MIKIFLLFFLLGVTLYAWKVLSRGGIILGGGLITFSIAGIFLVAFPENSTKIANHLGVGRGTDLLLYFFFVITIILIFHIHAKFKRQDILITELARHLALQEVQKND